LKLVRWHGNYEGIETTWLRWMTPEGELLTTPPEAQAMAERRAEAEAQRAEAEARRADAAEAEIARLKSLLAAQSDSPSGR
jgi:hypothetical protein